MSVIRISDISFNRIASLLSRYHLLISKIPINTSIPGSFWGESEAGLINQTLYVRNDTPVHSALHEASHYICMDATRRETLHTDAQGDYNEESAVCYLQILLANKLKPELDSQQLMKDMDAWGYSFRLGNTKAWFQHDSEDSITWLIKYGILEKNGKQLSGNLRH